MFVYDGKDGEVRGEVDVSGRSVVSVAFFVRVYAGWGV